MPRTSSFLVRRPRLPLSAFLFTPSLYSFRPTHLSRPAACVAGTQRRVGPSCLAGGGHSRSRSTLQEYVSLKTSGSDLEVLRMDKLLDVCVLSVLDVWLLFAARVGDAETVVALVGEGADVNVQDSEGSTPLMRCISRGHADVAEVLLDAPGIDLLLRNGIPEVLEIASPKLTEGFALFLKRGRWICQASSIAWSVCRGDTDGEPLIASILLASEPRFSSLFTQGMPLSLYLCYKYTCVVDTDKHSSVHGPQYYTFTRPLTVPTVARAPNR